MEFIISILLLLVLARALGELFEQLKQPAMVGEILVGIIVGPAVLMIIKPTTELMAIADISIFLLVFLAGYELKPEDIKKAVRGGSLYIGLFGFFVPLVSGFMLAIAFGFPVITAGFVGVCVSITAMPVTIRILMDLGKLKTPLGRKIVSAIVFDDIMALTILGILLSASENSTMLSIAVSGGYMVLKVFLFIVLIVMVNRLLRIRRGRKFLFPVWFDSALSKMKCRESLFAINILIVLIFAAIAQAIGLHFIVGAFFGSLIITREIIGEKYHSEVKRVASAVTFGFLAPIFFVYIGLEFSFESFGIPMFIIALICVAVAAKIYGGFVGAKFAGVNNKSALTIGIAINGRGIVELVIATIGYNAGLIDAAVFSALVLMGITTTIMAPLLLRARLGRKKSERTAGAQA